MSPRPRLLVLSQEPVGEQMAGPAIRAVELARAARDAGVAESTVAAPAGTLPDLPVVEWHPQDAPALHEPLATADAVYGVPQWPLVQRAIARSGAVQVS